MIEPISRRATASGDGWIEQGSLYPALQRLEKAGLVTSDRDTTDNNRRARYYQFDRRQTSRAQRRARELASRPARGRAARLVRRRRPHQTHSLTGARTR